MIEELESHIQELEADRSEAELDRLVKQSKLAAAKQQQSSPLVSPK